MKKRIGAACAVVAILGIVNSQTHRLRTDPAGLALIANSEGCQAKPYHCTANVLTVGVGSTGNVENRTYSNDEIAQRFIDDVRTAEQCVNRYANGAKLNQGQFNALTSLTFNVGCGALKKSTIFRHAKKGNYQAMCEQLDRWIYAGGKKSKGLAERRHRETAMCLATP